MNTPKPLALECLTTIGLVTSILVLEGITIMNLGTYTYSLIHPEYTFEALRETKHLQWFLGIILVIAILITLDLFSLCLEIKLGEIIAKSIVYISLAISLFLYTLLLVGKKEKN